MNKEIKLLKKQHKQKSSAIKKRLDDFKKLKNAEKEKKFLELCYCICTPMSNAKKVYKIINEKNKKILLSGKDNEVKKLLRTNCRFHNNKASYIVKARDFLNNLDKLPTNGFEARELLIKNVKGISYKEASHFLRNIGYRDLAILDGHIINSLHEIGFFKTNDRPKSPKYYLEMEKEMKRFAKENKIDLDELDLLLWSNKTGEILK
jgi:N-glycosylase/DNA lyase